MNRGKFTAALTALCAASAVPVGALASATPRTLVTLEDNFRDALGDAPNVLFYARPPLCRDGRHLSMGYKFVVNGGLYHGDMEVDMLAYESREMLVRVAKSKAGVLGYQARCVLVARGIEPTECRRIDAGNNHPVVDLERES